MKKIFNNKFFVAFILVSFLFSGFSGLTENRVYAVTATEEEAGIDGPTATLAGAVMAAAIAVFCPKVPQNRCKNGLCLQGACISFRTACATNSNCTPPSSSTTTEEKTAE